MKNLKSSSGAHILKIARPVAQTPGKKCYPRQTYGVSQESPDTFRTKNGVIAQRGYIFDDQKRISKYNWPLSQHKFCSVVGDTVDVVDNFREKYNSSLIKNSQTFHVRRGRFTEFSDKNLWMNKVCLMTGFERNAQGREISNKERQRNIRLARRYNIYQNPVQLKGSHSKQKDGREDLFTAKAKIKLERLSLQKQKQSAQQVQKVMKTSYQATPQNDRYVQAECLTNKMQMQQTMNHREWKYTMTNIRKKFRKQYDKNDPMNLTCSDWSTNNKSVELSSRRQKKQKPKDQLRQWYNVTLQEYGNPWIFKKAEKHHTGSDEQN